MPTEVLPASIHSKQAKSPANAHAVMMAPRNPAVTMVSATVVVPAVAFPAAIIVPAAIAMHAVAAIVPGIMIPITPVAVHYAIIMAIIALGGRCR
ncbi:MAG: hypothetical protein ABIR23_00570 [Novosphingobium sp.]